jgi:hypothetical protein
MTKFVYSRHTLEEMVRCLIPRVLADEVLRNPTKARIRPKTTENRAIIQNKRLTPFSIGRTLYPEAGNCVAGPGLAYWAKQPTLLLHGHRVWSV